MQIHTYRVGNTLPIRELTLACSDGGGWLDAGDVVALIDYAPDGTTATVPATVVTVGDATHPSMVTAAAPSTASTGNVLTEVRRTSLAGKIETFSEDLVFTVEP